MIEEDLADDFKRFAFPKTETLWNFMETNFRMPLQFLGLLCFAGSANELIEAGWKIVPVAPKRKFSEDDDDSDPLRPPTKK